MEGFKILFGRSKPIIRFTVEKDPPPMYFNFKIREDRVDELAHILNLPAGFALAKIRCLMDENQDNYRLTLNVYRVSGLTNGLRAEWSVYVKDPEGRTRYMIVEARSNKGSMDPIDIVTKKSKLEYSVEDNQIHIYIESNKGTYVKVETRIPEDPLTGFSTREWIRANDEIYWLNGIMDRSFHNSKMACAELILIPSEGLKIENTTKWGEFIEPDPLVVMYPSELEMLVSQWWNI
jgi:hypothetical protein